jgi:hypothetical protein
MQYKTPPLAKKDRLAIANANLEPLEQRPFPQEESAVEPRLLRKGQLSPIRK